MTKRCIFALALAAALPVSAQAADGPSFTYVEADYVDTDALGFDLDGFGLKGNVSFHENWYVTGRHSRTSQGDIPVGTDELDIDFERSELGAGFHTAIGSNVHFLAEVAYLRYGFETENSLGSTNESVNGYRAGAGVRALLGNRFELEGKANYADVEDIDGGFGAEVNGMFHINKTWGVGAGWERQDFDGGDVDEWHVGVRASF